VQRLLSILRVRRARLRPHPPLGSDQSGARRRDREDALGRFGGAPDLGRRSAGREEVSRRRADSPGRRQAA